MQKTFATLDSAIAGTMGRHGVLLLRISLGVIFIWFGLLKPLGLSPASELVERTVYWVVPPRIFVPVLGWWEVAIGICMLVRPLIRVAILLLAFQMAGTFLPLILLPDICYSEGRIPWGLTLEGQYIVKNLVVIGAAIVIGGTVRNRAKSDPGSPGSCRAT